VVGTELTQDDIFRPSSEIPRESPDFDANESVLSRGIQNDTYRAMYEDDEMENTPVHRFHQEYVHLPAYVNCLYRTFVGLLKFEKSSLTALLTFMSLT
jgi:hypothetical protein